MRLLGIGSRSKELDEEYPVQKKRRREETKAIINECVVDAKDAVDRSSGRRRLRTVTVAQVQTNEKSEVFEGNVCEDLHAKRRPSRVIHTRQTREHR